MSAFTSASDKENVIDATSTHPLTSSKCIPSNWIPSGAVTFPLADPDPVTIIVDGCAVVRRPTTTDAEKRRTRRWRYAVVGDAEGRDRAIMALIERYTSSVTVLSALSTQNAVPKIGSWK